MRKILLSDIIIRENRQRTEFDSQALADLKESIEQRGLMHPPVLRSEGSEMVLVAGERRLRAIAELHELGVPFSCDGEVLEEGWCPYTTLGDLSPLEAEEAELDENLKRMDLTWQEHAAATARLHKLRGLQKAEVALQTYKATGNPGTPAAVQQSVAETALELLGRSDGAYQDQIRKEIIVAKHLANPAIAKAKSADEAFKILKKAETAEKNVELARLVGKTFNANLHMLLHRDCLSYMEEQVALVKDYPEEAFDVILTDPPYGMGADSFGDAGGKLAGIEHRYDDSPEAWRALMLPWCDLSYAITKPRAHAYVFCDFDKFHELKGMMELAGWYVFRTPLVVHKLNSGRVPLPDQGPRRQYEIILYAIKGKKQTTHIYPDVIPCGADENMSHGAQKPVALFQNLLQRSVQAGDRVLDTFAGSGTIFEAAHAFKVTAVGVERNQEYYGMSLARLARLKQLEQPALF